MTAEHAACCAHLHVIYEKVRYADGTCSDSWACRDCRAPFWPASPAQDATTHNDQQDTGGSQ